MWRGRTSSSGADAYLSYLKETGVADYPRTPGCAGAYVLRKLNGDVAEFLVSSLGESSEAISGFAGSDLETPVHYTQDESLLLELEPYVRHYEIILSSSCGTWARRRSAWL
jgi:hypothetical protein